MVVRREKVELILEDQYTAPVLRAAAATQVLRREINDLSGNAVRGQRSTNGLERDISKTGATAQRSGRDIDQYSGRLRILAEILASVGPAAIPITAVAVPAVSGLLSVLGFATTAIGASALAFRGFGDVMDAVSKARLEPTTENLENLRTVLAGLPPETAAFARELRDFLPVLDQMSKTAAAGLFPGLAAGLDGLREAAPQLLNVIEKITQATGDVAADAGASIASGRWDEFLDFLAVEGPQAMAKMSEATGNLTHGLAGLWMSTTPLNNDFLNWLTDATARFDRWSNELGQTDGFREFIGYIRDIGPQVGDTLGAIGNAFVQLIQAIAPLGGPSLRILEAIADAIATIADSPLGTPLLGLISAMATLSLGTRAYHKVQEATFGSPAVARFKATATGLMTVTSAQDRARMSAQQLAKVERERAAANRAGVRSFAGTAAGLGAIALAGSGVAEQMGLTNTMTLAAAGSLAGPWGTAVGAAVGGIMDLSNALSGGSENSAEFAQHLDLLMASAGNDKAAQIRALTAEMEKYQQALGGSDVGQALADKASKPYQERIDLLQHQIDLENAAGQAAAQNADYSAAAQKRLALALSDARKEAQQGNEAFLNYGNTLGDLKVSLDDWMEDLRTKAKALSNLAQNTTDLADRGLNKNVIEWLRSQGPEGALRLQQLAEGGDAAIREMNRSWRQFAVAGKENVKAGQDVAQAIEDTRRKAEEASAKRYMFQIDANTDPAKSALEALIRSYQNRNVRIKVTTSTNANNAEQEANDNDRPKKPKKEHYRGGYTGKGGKYEPAGVVHKREFVFSSEATDGNEAFLDGLHRSLRGYDKGGLVGGPLGTYITRDLDMKFPQTLKQWEKALERSKDAIEKERSARDGLVSKRNDLRDAVAGGFLSDIFGGDRPSNWEYFSEADKSKYLAGRPLDILKKDTANAAQFDGLLKALAGKGLDGPLFEALARSTDIDQARALMTLSTGQIAEYEKAYADRARVTSGVGSYVGDRQYSKQIAESNDHLKGIRHDHRLLVREVASLKKQVARSAKAHAKDVNRGRQGHQNDLMQQLADG